MKDLLLQVEFVPESLRRESCEQLSMFDESEQEWVLTHGDYGVHNTLLDEENRLSILDWEWAEWASLLTDIAWVCWFTKLHYPKQSEVLINSFMKEYVSHHNISISAELLKHYALYRVWYILFRVQNASVDVQEEWNRRLEWTLRMDFSGISLNHSKDVGVITPFQETENK